MKKYDVRGLNIISVKEGKNIRYLLCKYNCLKNCYIDIFTKEKINVEDKNNIYNLCDNITFIVETDYVVGDKMILEKKDLLGVWENVRNELYLSQSEKLIKLEQANTLFDYDNILNNAILNFFPKEGCWSGCCFNKSTELKMSNLPCHLRNNNWLARMIKNKNNLYFISDSKILEFIKNSTLFIEKRKEYELEIVKWQINHILTHGENWICDENYGGDIVYITPVVDLGVRKGVIDTLTAIGMNNDVIEEGLEKYADLWREKFMELAFNNEYNNNFSAYFRNPNLEFKYADNEFKEKWLKMRRYEYYQRHKHSVDLYGVVLPDMLMSKEEVAELKIYLDTKQKERKNYLEKINNIEFNDDLTCTNKEEKTLVLKKTRKPNK